MQKTEKAFKACPLCNRIWESRSDFLKTSNLRLRGYQADIDKIENGLFLFNHIMDNCGTTLAIPVYEFFDLYQEIRYPKSRFGSDVCEMRCLNRNDLEICGADCANAFIREILQIIKSKLHNK